VLTAAPLAHDTSSTERGAASEAADVNVSRSSPSASTAAAAAAAAAGAEASVAAVADSGSPSGAREGSASDAQQLDESEYRPSSSPSRPPELMAADREASPTRRVVGSPGGQRQKRGGKGEEEEPVSDEDLEKGLQVCTFVCKRVAGTSYVNDVCANV